MSKLTKDPRQSQAWRKLSKRCYERDKAANARCWLCGGQIDYSVKPSSTPESYEPDHYFPVDSHPELALIPDNVRPSCRSCNRSRRNKAGVDNIGNRTRMW